MTARHGFIHGGLNATSAGSHILAETPGRRLGPADWAHRLGRAGVAATSCYADERVRACAQLT
jgi:hypothetical protein